MSDGDPRDAPPGARVASAEAPGPSGVPGVVVGVAVVGALYFGRDVLIPITLAMLLTFVLAPLADRLQRLGLGRAPSAVIAAAFALGVALALGGVIGTQLAQLARDAPRYYATVEGKAETLRRATVGRVSGIVRDLGDELERMRAARDARRGEAGRAAPEAPAGAGSPGTAADEERPMPVVVREPNPSPFDVAERILAPALAPLATAFIVFIVAVFALLQRLDLRDRLIRLFGSRDLQRTTAALDDAGRRLSRYFLTQLGINTAYGTATAAALFLIGVPGAVLWGILAGLMRFVPYVGTPIAALPPIAVAAAVDPGWSVVAWTAAYFLVGEFLMGQAVEPVAFGRTTGLSPFSVVVAAIFWTWIWGPVGLLLATPLTVCLAVLGRHVERLEFLGVLLSDRPALTAAENFYQRMLAGDPDEAQDQAEQLLKERSLSAYYDEVALEGLRLAAQDALRGALGGPQLDRVEESIRGLIEALADHEDVDPRPERAGAGRAPPLPAEPGPPGRPAPRASAPAGDDRAPGWRAEAPVLCIAGRGPLDEAAAAMLAQLLRKRGLGARTAPHEAVSRAATGSLDTAGVAMVCVSYLNTSGSPSHLRYLLRRLRQRLPAGTPILVGLWPADDAMLRDQNLRATVGADHCVTSLREALDTCVKASWRAADGSAPTARPAGTPPPAATPTAAAGGIRGT